MKNVLVMALMFVALAACSKPKVAVPERTTEQVVDTRSATVREVQFVNNDAGRAVTQVRVDEKGAASLATYAILEYHPEVIVGTPVSITNVYRERLGFGKYITRVCVNPDSPSQVCGDN